MKKTCFLGALLVVKITMQASERPSSLKDLCLNTIRHTPDSLIIKNSLHTIPNDLLRTIIQKCPPLAITALRCIANRGPIETNDATLIAHLFPNQMWELIHNHNFDEAYNQTFPTRMLNHGNEEKIKCALESHIAGLSVGIFDCLHEDSAHYDAKYLKKVFDQQQRYSLVIDNHKAQITIEGNGILILLPYLDDLNQRFMHRAIENQYALLSHDQQILALIFVCKEELINTTNTTIVLVHKTHMPPYICISLCEHYHVLACAFTKNGIFMIQIQNNDQQTKNLYTFEIPYDFLSPSLSLQQILHTVMRNKLDQHAHDATSTAKKLAERQESLPIAKKLLYSQHATWTGMNQHKIHFFIEFLKRYQEDFLINNGGSLRKRYPSATAASTTKIKQLLPVTLAHLPVTCKLTLLHQADAILQKKGIKQVVPNLETFIDILLANKHSDETIRTILRPMFKNAIDNYMAD